MRAIASDLHCAGPDLLLSMSELSRVKWKPGLRQGELHVEITAVEDGSYEMGSVEADINDEGDHIPVRTIPRGRMPAVHLSRVGTYGDDFFPKGDI